MSSYNQQNQVISWSRPFFYSQGTFFGCSNYYCKPKYKATTWPIPVFPSQKLATVEFSIEKEALCGVVGVTTFHSFLYGHSFTLQTDHKPLLILLNPAKVIISQAANRIERWALDLGILWLVLQLRLRRSEQHCNADELRRLPLAEVPAWMTVPGEAVNDDGRAQ